MKRILTLFCLLFNTLLNAQTFTGTGGGIPDGGPMVTFPLTVSGLVPTNIDTIFGLETVCIEITHTWDADLNISLQSPDGSIVDLSIGNGGDGDNYTGTCFNASSTTSIVTATAPFTGAFRPQGFIGALNNGQVGNGVWNLLITDTYAADVGTLINWSITFGNAPAHPFIFTSSDLPIVSINTFGTNIPDEPKINAFMGIIDNGAGVRNYMTDPFNNYKNKIGIELRGSSSMSFPQKAYGIETRNVLNAINDTAILQMPAEHDWILYAPYDDKTCMRNVLSYDIANKTGHYASRTRFCELLINGQYQGIYVMMEKVKRDNNRVAIAKLTASDTVGDDLTGGYIIKIDKQTGSGGTDGWNSTFLSGVGSNIFFQYSYPASTSILPIQKTYIKSYVDSFEIALSSVNFTDATIGYRKYIDVNSFIDYFILNEISKNVDGYRLSTYMFKDKGSNGGKLHIGPAWDYNLGWWNAGYCEGELTTGWAYDFGNVCPGDYWQIPFWWDRLMQDPMFTYELKCRWLQLRSSTLSTSNLTNFVDSVGNYLNEAQARHFTAWPILGQYTWPNPSPIPTSYAGELTALKTWIQNRIPWLDANMPGNCNVGIEENNYVYDLNVYPNPFCNKFHLTFYLRKSENLKIEIVDMLGNIIQSAEKKEFGYGATDLDISLEKNAYANGIYFLKIISQEGTLVKKINKSE